MSGFRLIVVVCASLAMIGCTTVQPLSVDAGQLSRELAPGDRVELTTRGGERLQFALENVDEVGVRGDGRQIAYTEIESIGRRETSTGRTALVVLGVAAAIAAVAAGGSSSSSGGY